MTTTWPATIGIRPSAMPAWKALTRALAVTTVPCRSDPESWTSDDAEVRKTAALVCRDCPVVQLCGDAARANRERFGVWGSLDLTARPGRPKEKTA